MRLLRWMGVVTFLLLNVNCANHARPSLPPEPSPPPAQSAHGPLFTIYQQYLDAIDRGDLASAKQLVTKGKRRNLDAMDDAKALAEINVVSPKEGLRPLRELTTGDDATLVVRARVSENESIGRIQFARERGDWRIVSESWDVGASDLVASAGPAHGKNERQRAAFRKLQEKGFPQPAPEFLVMSAGKGDLEAVKLFVDAGYSVDAVSQGSPAIVSAAMFRHPDIVKYLIDAGAKVNAVDEVNTTALMRLADQCDATDVVKALLKAGARTDIKSRGNTNAEQLAEFGHCDENARLIRAAHRKK